jgi:signal transduction histidine kinase
MATDAVLDEGTLSFSIESRVLRELGERLVKQPEVAIVELIKNAHDADATECEIDIDSFDAITVKDNGHGMTLDQFTHGWMRIGTSAKEGSPTSPAFHRPITGEKGIGRFAVRFLGRHLHLISVAEDKRRRQRTLLIAEFDWQLFDQHEDLGTITVPYRLERAAKSVPTGTSLVISALRPQSKALDLTRVRTGSIGVLTPLRSMFRELPGTGAISANKADPGFILNLKRGSDDPSDDVAAEILNAYVLRATVELKGNRMSLKVFTPGEGKAYYSIVDTYKNDIGALHADIRFFPRRKGAFANSPIDGRQAYGWIKRNSGVTIFDRDFRVQPYGAPSDDWLQLSADTARNRREPRSPIAEKHFAMSPAVKSDTGLNWMLRLPQSAQLVGLVQVEGRRTKEQKGGQDSGLIVAADREGFVENDAFGQLRDLIRGAVEAIAFCDRQIQNEEAERLRKESLKTIRAETRSAIAEVESNSAIATRDKERLVGVLLHTEQFAERQGEAERERVQQLEIMSLLGVVAGFMTHEFGTALQELKDAQKTIRAASKRSSELTKVDDTLSSHIKNLSEYVTYSTGYVAGSKAEPTAPYPVRPRIQQMIRVFGHYASDRNIEIETFVDRNLEAPLVPVSLYNGIVLNLYTNALKAVTGMGGSGPRAIAFRAWNDDRWHHLEVSDTGVGIPAAIRSRVFDPLFTTTDSRRDPLGSGMGLGLALVRRGVEAFGGQVDVVDPPPDFSTCVRVRIPLERGAN